MKPLTRIRIIIFALMIFGAFANFALNEWGLSIITYCELAITLSFLADIVLELLISIKRKEKIKFSKFQLIITIGFILMNLLFIFLKMEGQAILGMAFFILWGLLLLSIFCESIYDLIKKQDNQNKFEHFFLAMFFYGLYFKNNHFPGANLLLVFGVFFLIPHYVFTTIQFYKTHFRLSKQLVTVLTFGSIATILLGISNLFKTMHWPFGTIILYIALIPTAVMLFGALKWKFIYNNETINIFKGLRLFKSQIILLFYLNSILIGYKYLVAKKIAPDFKTQALPAVIYKLRESGLKTDEQILEHDIIMEVYFEFVDHAKKNGFVK
jgi:hypothetical protein